MRRIFQVVFFALLAAAFAQTIWHGAHLPERVATHFDLSGKPDGWTSRNIHLATQCGLMLFIGLVISLLASHLHRLPDRFVNLPHKEHWLSATRRAETFSWLAGMIHAVGAAAVIFFLFFFQRVYEANLTGSGRLSIRLLPMIVCQFIFVFALVICLLLRFRAPPATRPESKRSQRLRR